MMQGLLTKRKNMVAGGLLLLLAVGILTSGKEGAGPESRSSGYAGLPLQGVASSIGGVFGSFFDRFLFFSGSAKEAVKLREEVEALRFELLKAEEYRAENERLKSLLAFKEASYLDKMVPARVIGRSASAWYRTIVLNRGSLDGIKVGAPVVTSYGVVGRVYESGDSASRVLLLTDASSALDGILQRTRGQVLVEGDMTPSPKLLYITRGTDIEEGDKIITSGLDGFFPKGLVLGHVAEVSEGSGDMFVKATLEPAVNFARIEEVFVITDFYEGVRE
ncbi:rod shape-determining protein MreC [bacterium]|nr:MAG: rod shape-determining protein MreC [bacterium]